MTDIRRVHHRSSSKHEYDYENDHEHKSTKQKTVSSRVVKKEPTPVSASSKRLKITVTNDRRSSISPSPLRSKPAKTRSKTRSRSRGRKADAKSSKKTETHKTKKSSPQTKSKNKESRKKKSRTRSPLPRAPPRSRSRSASPGRYYTYPYHYYDYYYGSRSRSRSASRSPDPYRSKPVPYPPGYYPPGPPPSRYRHMYPGMRYPPPAASAAPYYPPPQGYMSKFGKFGRPRYYPAEDAEPYYSGTRHPPGHKPKKEDPKDLEPNEAMEEPKSPSSTDPELTDLVCEITSAIANASAEGREYTLSDEQKRTLEKHQQLLQEYQQKKQKYQQLLKLRQQSQLNPEQMSMLLANKKFPNYRLLGRNIFEPNNKQKVFQKRVKTNTYYSRFIKQHPTNNLPLVFQKSIGLNEDKVEEVGDVQKKKKKSKKKKKASSSSSDSLSESDADKKSKKKQEDVLEDGQIQPTNNESEAGSSDSDSGSSGSTSSSLSNASEKRARRKKAAKFNNDARNGHTDSDSSMLELKEHLKPIGAYIKDRERMLNEMFRCIKGSKLKAMLPDILKTKQLRDIKERCLEALECMSKKRIRCLLADQPMLSSSGTEESSEDESNSSLNSDSERSFGRHKKAKSAGQESKFRPIGADTLKQSEETGQYESNEDSQASQPGKEEKNTHVSKSATGIAAAGFKNFVKKSISIKIKTNDQFGGSSPSDVTTLQSTASQLTDLQKQQMAISNKLARKIKTDTTAAPLVHAVQAEEKAAPQMPKTASDLTSLAQIRPQIAATSQAGQGLLPTPSLPPSARPGFMPVPAPNTYAYPPGVRMPGLAPGGVVARPPGVYPPMAPYNMVPQAAPAPFQNINQPVAQPFQTQGQSLLGPVPTHLPPQFQFNQRYQDDYPSFLDEEEEFGDDAAYDLDDNAYNYDLDEDLDSIINESRSKRKDKESKKHRSKKSSKKHKRKKHESESESENLDSIKDMLKNVLEAHMDQLDEPDYDLKMTLAGLLDQIVNDDGSLTYDDCVNIHETVKALFGDREEGEESDEELRPRKKKKSSTKRRNKSSEDLKPSKKKRKENGKRHESEEGEIDDVYDDDEQFIVEKEYQDLLK